MQQNISLNLLSDEEAQKEIEKRLLSGWTLIQDICPITSFPLVKDPKSEVIWSVKAQLPVKFEESERNYSTGRSKEEQNTSEMDKKNFNSANNKKDINIAQDDLISSRLGEKLLLGWTMTEENCPVSGKCPLMMDPKTGKLWSAALGDFIEDFPRTNRIADDGRQMIEDDEVVFEEPGYENDIPPQAVSWRELLEQAKGQLAQDIAADSSDFLQKKEPKLLSASPPFPLPQEKVAEIKKLAVPENKPDGAELYSLSQAEQGGNNGPTSVSLKTVLLTKLNACQRVLHGIEVDSRTSTATFDQLTAVAKTISALASAIASLEGNV